MIAAANPTVVIGDFHIYKKKLLDYNFNCKKTAIKKLLLYLQRTLPYLKIVDYKR